MAMLNNQRVLIESETGSNTKQAPYQLLHVATIGSLSLFVQFGVHDYKPSPVINIFGGSCKRFQVGFFKFYMPNKFTQVGCFMAGWWFGTFFPQELMMMIQSDELIFFRGVAEKTTNQMAFGLSILPILDGDFATSGAGLRGSHSQGLGGSATLVVQGPRAFPISLRPFDEVVISSG